MHFLNSYGIINNKNTFLLFFNYLKNETRKNSEKKLHKRIILADSNARGLRALPEHFFRKFMDVEKNALFCNTCRIRVMKDEVLEEE